MSTFGRKGFTLVEILIVMVIIQILGMVAYMNLVKLQDKQCLSSFSVLFSNEFSYFQTEGGIRIRENEFDSLYKGRDGLELPNSLCGVEKKENSEYEYFKNLFVTLNHSINPYDVESLLRKDFGRLSDNSDKEKAYTLVSTFYPDINKEKFGIEPEEPKSDPVDYNKLLSTVLGFIGKIFLVVFAIWAIIKVFFKMTSNLSQQLKYHRFFTYLLKYRLFKKMLGVGEGVDTELYFTFQQLLLNYELNYSTMSKWSLTVNGKKIITIKGVGNSKEDIETLEGLSCICKGDEEIDDVLTISVDNFDVTPTYLKRMIIEKIISTIKYNIEVSKITERTSKINQEKTELLKEVEKKRSFLDEIKGTTQVKDFADTLTTVVEMEKISREYEALSQKMKALKDKKV